MPPASRPLSVALLHNYRERQQMSMKLYAEKLGESLTAQGVDVQHVKPPDVLSSRVQRLPLMAKADSYLGRFALYPYRARRLRGDLFHIVDHGQAHLLHHLDSHRTVVTCHDVILLVLESGRLGPNTRFRPPLATRVLRYAISALRDIRWIVADSSQTRSDLADLAGIDPATVTVIFPGLNHPFRPVPEAREKVRRARGLGAGPLLLHVGQVGFYKNVPGVLRVLAQLRAGGVDARLVRTGQRLAPDHLALAHRLGIEASIHDLGPTGPEELNELYNCADVLLFPSLYEGFGWPPLEAMAAGLPVVCSRAGSLAEVVADAAFTAEPEDISGLAEQCADLLTKPALREQLRNRGFARAAQFSWAKTAEQMRALYARVLES